MFCGLVSAFLFSYFFHHLVFLHPSCEIQTGYGDTDLLHTMHAETIYYSFRKYLTLLFSITSSKRNRFTYICLLQFIYICHLFIYLFIYCRHSLRSQGTSGAATATSGCDTAPICPRLSWGGGRVGGRRKFALLSTNRRGNT